MCGFTNHPYFASFEPIVMKSFVVENILTFRMLFQIVESEED